MTFVQRSRRRATAGFTLVELMVALTAGLLAIAAAYTLSTASSRTFHAQQRISQTQMSLRMAMEQIRRDVQRAGFGGIANTRTARMCANVAPPGGHFSMMEFVDSGSTAALPNAAVNRTEADSLILTGNYVTSDVFYAQDAGPSMVRVQTQWQGFRRTFGVPTNSDFFEDVFQPGRMVHLRTTGRRHFFAQIVGSSGANATVRFNPGFQCAGERTTQAMISPMSRVRYRVVAPNAAFANLSTATDDARGLTNAILIREEVDFDDNPIAGTERVVMEYAAGLDFEFVVDNNVTPGLPPNFQREPAVDNPGAADPAPSVDTNAERIRSVIVTLSARTADHDREFPWVEREAGQPFSRYQVNPAMSGAARVRTMRTEIFLPNGGAN